MFRYLADHPDVCGSSRKETQFFIKHRGGISEKELEEYSTFFSHCEKSSKVRLEATPHYLHFADSIAATIHATLPDAKMVFILREPASRLYTGFRNLRELENKVFGAWSFDEFVENAITHQEQPDNNTQVPELRAAYYMHTGCYARYLRKYLETFGPNRVHIVFFDHLVSDPRLVMTHLTEFIAIDDKFYDTYSFTQENRTRAYRSRLMHHAAHRANQILEPTLNRLPSLRKKVRSLYNLINESERRKEAASEDALSALREFYRPHNAQLQALLGEIGYKDMPAWLCSEHDLKRPKHL